ncbi:MAG: DUF4160 domain-containing protein [Firmicutes bacterium]|nr:DUF4160 domain-containing protein [Bacillota bacterium]
MGKITIEFVDEDIDNDCCEESFFKRISNSYEYTFRSKTTIKNFLLYIYKCLDIGYIPDNIELQERFRIKVANKYINPNINFNLQKFLTLNGIDKKIFVHYIIGLGGGNGALISELANIRINANEGKHKDTPHVHLYKKGNNDCIRIELNTLTQMKGDKRKFEEIFNNKERKQILDILQKYQMEFIEFYESIQKGEAPKKIIIEHDKKEITFK